MIKAKDAIRIARSYIGTPYADMDCIHLIIAVIRNAPGGVKDYRCQGTNWLWDSVNNSGKYQHLTARYESLSGAKAGMLAFKRYGLAAEDHVGLVTGEGTVIHSSSVGGRGVVETPLTPSEGWDLLGVHRYIDVANDAAESENESVTAYKMQVSLNNPNDPDNYLSVRKGPGTQYDIIGKLGHGAIVVVQSKSGDWAFVTYGDSGSGYVSYNYLEMYEEPIVVPDVKWTTLTESSGTVVSLKGEWRIADD